MIYQKAMLNNISDKETNGQENISGKNRHDFSPK